MLGTSQMCWMSWQVRRGAACLGLATSGLSDRATAAVLKTPTAEGAAAYSVNKLRDFASISHMTELKKPGMKPFLQ